MVGENVPSARRLASPAASDDVRGHPPCPPPKHVSRDTGSFLASPDRCDRVIGDRAQSVAVMALRGPRHGRRLERPLNLLLDQLRIPFPEPGEDAQLRLALA